MDSPYRPPSANLHAQDSYAQHTEVSREVSEIMRGTRPWPVLIGILSLINTAFVTYNFFQSANLAPIGFAGALGAFVTLLIFVFLDVKLIAYSSKIGRFSQTNYASDLERALAEHRLYWKIFGVAVLILLILLAIVFLFAGAAGVSRAVR